MEKSSKCSKLLPYHIIAAAASGDVEAINEVLKHFSVQGFMRLMVIPEVFVHGKGMSVMGYVLSVYVHCRF